MVLLEAGLILLVLRSLGKLQQQGAFATRYAPPFANGGLEVGEQAPSFAAVNLDGQTVEFDDLRGQNTLLAFVSPQCSACSLTIEALNQAISRDHKLTVVAVGGDDLRANRQYAATHQAQIPILTPTSASVKDLYRIQSIPYAFALDSAGVIRAAGVVNASEHVRNLLTTAFA